MATEWPVNLEIRRLSLDLVDPRGVGRRLQEAHIARSARLAGTNDASPTTS